MAPRSYRFASFTLDLDRRSLRTPRGEVMLRHKSFEVLRYLLERAPRAVSKDELMGAVWSVHVTGDSLTHCISEVRKALGAEGSDILRTRAKHGYCIEVPVVAVEDPIEKPGPSTVADGPPQVDAPAAPAPPRSIDPERRQLTILVCDMVGLTALAASLELEDLREVIAAYERCVREVIERHGGSMAPRRAESVHAYFGYPAAADDDVERAVRAGLAVARAVGELATKAPAGGLQARVGIATGLVVVGEPAGTGRAGEPELVGEPPILAARLAALAAPGAVVMSGATRRIVGGLFECRALDAADVQGSAEPAGAFLVLGEDATADRFAALRGRTPLVGRGEELDRLLQRWEQAKKGNGRMVLVTGESGIGKSRITRALQERLADQPHTTVIYHCSPNHRDTALYPVVTQVLRAAGIRRTDGPDVKLRKLQALLEFPSRTPDEDVALIAALLSIPAGERYPLPDLSPQEVKQRTLEALMGVFRRLCAFRPVLAIYEDLHWIDPTSLELLSRAVNEIPNLPLLLVATARKGFRPPWPEHWHTMTMPLAGLAPSEVETLIGSVAQGKTLPPEVIAEVVARTDGVPLFVEELTKLVLESEMLRDAGDRYELTGPLLLREIPSTLYASLAARLDRLPAVKDIAQVGAAIGVEFSYGLIAAVSAVPEPDLQAGLDQLVSAELIFQRGVPPDSSYRFKHALVRDAAYGSLVRERRQLLHGKIARALEEKFPSVAAMAPETLAHHYAEAGVLDKAAFYHAKAGRLSLERSAMVEASAQLERALALLGKLPETAERRRQEVDLRRMLFQAYLTRGEIERMTATLIEAVEIAKALGDERRLAFATAQLATAQWMRGEHAAAAASARFVLDHVERTAKLTQTERTENLTLEMFGKYTLANTHHGQGRLEEAIALHREIIETLARLGLENQRLGWPGLPSVMSRAFLCWFLIEAGRFDEAREVIERGCALADANRQPYSEVLIHAGEGLYHLRRGYPELAVPVLEPTLKMCQRVHTMEAILAGWLGTALVAVGRAAEALGVTEEAFRRGAHLAGGRYTWFYLFKAIGEAHAALGNVAEAFAWADKAIQVTQETNESLHYAQGLKCRGDMQLRLAPSAEEAMADLELARTIGADHGLLPLVAECDLSLARARARAGRTQEARQLAARAAEAFRALKLDRYLAEAEQLAK
jgi:class 3 adenylate cyclase/tetratricopeptide (TPR) repeat protein